MTRCHFGTLGSIPAWAGNPYRPRQLFLVPRVHPRVGGEPPQNPLLHQADQGPSPRGRGTLSSITGCNCSQCQLAWDLLGGLSCQRISTLFRQGVHALLPNRNENSVEIGQSARGGSEHLQAQAAGSLIVTPDHDDGAASRGGVPIRQDNPDAFPDGFRKISRSVCAGRGFGH